MSYLPSKPGKTILPEILKMWPERSSKIVQYHEEIMRGPSSFTVAERELIFAYGSGVNACQWCHGAHKHTAAEFGVDLNLFEQLMVEGSEDLFREAGKRLSTISYEGVARLVGPASPED